MSKYWRKDETMIATHSRFEKSNWHDPETAPRDGTIFMGHILHTNRHVATKWHGDSFWNVSDPARPIPIEICEWQTFVEFADVRNCPWNSPARGGQ